MKEQTYLTRQRIQQAFETFDTDGSQSLSVEEVSQALGGDTMAKNIMKRFDIDGDGEISLEEFQMVMDADEKWTERERTQQQQLNTTRIR